MFLSVVFDEGMLELGLVLVHIISYHIIAYHCVNYEYPGVPAAGQSSSVMLDQNTHIMITERRVKSVSNMPPLILPCTPWQMCTETTNWKI
jgi:hypothetical protein